VTMEGDTLFRFTPAPLILQTALNLSTGSIG